MNFTPQTFEALHLQFKPMVKQVCLGYVKGDEEAANDLTQEIFMNVWNALAGFEGRSSYKTWVYRITVNTCLSYLRKNKKLLYTSLDTEHSEMNADTSEADEYDLLFAAIGQLKEMDRLIIMMVLDDLSYDEIGEVIGINPTNLRVRIHRIKTRLKEIIENGKF
ncbi:RNA polymerase sigma factor [Marivirga sp. S37H4]|uniref:RNA polymerase sigma factor n=1 Tax=Marivirga aurantiaca TaxID=2802615 RepID=A0A935C7D2_9BACT|nr:RNA polymerase sigma factor [Marivirga aurantiaca]MBK6264941.1 RNA polymerase sigma factor [Marivirga aurantiaca]